MWTWGNREPLKIAEQLICKGMDRAEVSNITKIWPGVPILQCLTLHFLLMLLQPK